MVPMLMKIGPPGMAKALISFWGTTWKRYGHVYCWGITLTNLLPSCCTYCVTGLESGSTGICLKTSAAACKPSFCCCSRDMLTSPGDGSSGADLTAHDDGGATSSNAMTMASIRAAIVRCVISPLPKESGLEALGSTREMPCQFSGDVPPLVQALGKSIGPDP